MNNNQIAAANGDAGGSVLVRRAFSDAAKVLSAFSDDTANLARIDDAADLLHRVFTSGGKVLACGNGGSAADAMHFCEELTGRFRKPAPGQPDRPPMPAIACTDAGHLTCVANDYGYDEVFARWTKALGKPGDVLVAISTSGNSASVVRAVDEARSIGMHAVALLGGDGGKLRGCCDIEWIVPTAEGGHADRVQEIHMLILHTLIEAVESRLR